MYRSLRTKTWLPLAMAFVMVAGSWVFAATVLPQNAGQSVRSEVGTRDNLDTPFAISAKELAGIPSEEPQVAGAPDSALAAAENARTYEIELTSIEQRNADGTVKRIAPPEGVMIRSQPGAPSTKGGSDDSVSSDPSLRVQLCCIDAGGPYGGPTVVEGSTVHLTATQTGGSTTLVFIRWDFNNDGVWDQTPTYNAATGWSTDFDFDMLFVRHFAESVDTVEAAWRDRVQRTQPQTVDLNTYLSANRFIYRITLAGNPGRRMLLPDGPVVVSEAFRAVEQLRRLDLAGETLDPPQLDLVRDRHRLAGRGDEHEQPARGQAADTEHARGNGIEAVKVEQQPAVELELHQHLADARQSLGCQHVGDTHRPLPGPPGPPARHSHAASPRARQRVCDTDPSYSMSWRSSSASAAA